MKKKILKFIIAFFIFLLVFLAILYMNNNKTEECIDLDNNIVSFTESNVISSNNTIINTLEENTSNEKTKEEDKKEEVKTTTTQSNKVKEKNTNESKKETNTKKEVNTSSSTSKDKVTISNKKETSDTTSSKTDITTPSNNKVPSNTSSNTNHSSTNDAVKEETKKDEVADTPENDYIEIEINKKPTTNSEEKKEEAHKHFISVNGGWFNTADEAEAEVDRVFKDYTRQLENGDLSWEKYNEVCPIRIRGI